MRERLGRTQFLHCLLCLSPTLELALNQLVEPCQAVLGEPLLFVLSELDRHSNSIPYDSHSRT